MTSTALVTKLLVIEQLLHPALKCAVSAPWHNFQLCPSSQQILATPLALTLSLWRTCSLFWNFAFQWKSDEMKFRVYCLTVSRRRSLKISWASCRSSSPAGCFHGSRTIFRRCRSAPGGFRASQKWWRCWVSSLSVQLSTTVKVRLKRWRS